MLTDRTIESTTMATIARTVSKSKLRDRQVMEQAQRAPIEIQMAPDETDLVLGPKSEWLASHELNDLAKELIATLTAGRMRGSVPAALLGDVAFIADWTTEEKELFYDGFMAALFESLRINDPTPARAFLRLMAARDVEDPSPTLTGKVDGDARKIAEARFGCR